MKRIPASEVKFHCTSYADPNGRVFWWRGKLLRGITPNQSQFYLDLFRNGTIDRLVKKDLLVETELTDWQLEGYPIVLSHRPIHFVSYPYEWCGAMLQQAALRILDLQIELTKSGLALQDGHAWNVLFEATNPVFVDFTSIVPVSRQWTWPALEEYHRKVVNPLKLFALRQGHIARWLLRDSRRGVTEEDVLSLSHGVPRIAGGVLRKCRLLPRWIYHYLPAATQKIVHDRWFAASERLLSDTRRLKIFEALRRTVESIRPRPPRGEWSSYGSKTQLPLVPNESWNPKQQTIYEVLRRLRPKTVIDVAANRGWYSQVAATCGAFTVAFDTEESAITALYDDAKRQQLSVLPLIVDMHSLPSSYGFGVRKFMAPVERLRGEMVIALAITHHLVFTHFLPFDQVVDGLSTLTTKHLIIEFVDRDDPYVAQWLRQHHGWYTKGNFRLALERVYRRVDELKSENSHRTIFICSDKRQEVADGHSETDDQRVLDAQSGSSDKMNYEENYLIANGD